MPISLGVQPSLKRAGLDSSLQVVFLVARHGWASLHRSCSCVSFHAAASMMALLRKPAPDTRLTVPCCSWLTRPHPWISVRRGAAELSPFATIFVCCDGLNYYPKTTIFIFSFVKLCKARQPFSQTQNLRSNGLHSPHRTGISATRAAQASAARP
jgi:hypothetical protein